MGLLDSIKANKVPTTLQGNILIYGSPKMGKTSTVYNLYKDKALFLAFERGYLFLDGVMAIDITKPSDVQKIVRELKADGKKTFDTVVFDVVDIFAKMYETYTCQLNGVDELSRIAWGGGWSKWEQECDKVIQELERCGYNIVFVSHASSKTMVKYNEDGKEVEYEKMMPTCPKRILNLIAKRCDHLFYIDQEIENGKPVRYLYTRDCEHHMAGSRVAKLPSKILLDANKIQEEIKKAVNSEEHTTNEKVKPIVKEEVNFDELKEEVTEIVMTYFHPNDLMNEVTKITDEVLGLSVKVNDLTPMQSDALEIVKLKLEEKAEELGLK